MALIASDCDAMRSPSINKWPELPRIVRSIRHHKSVIELIQKLYFPSSPPALALAPSLPPPPFPSPGHAIAGRRGAAVKAPWCSISPAVLLICG